MADTGPLQSLGLARVAIATAGGDADEAVRLLVGALAFAIHRSRDPIASAHGAVAACVDVVNRLERPTERAGLPS